MPGLYPQIIAPEQYQSSIQETCNPLAWSCLQDHIHIGLTPGGLTDIHYLASGAYMVAGVPVCDVPGDQLTDKIQYVLSQEGAAWFVGQAHKTPTPDQYTGFSIVHDEDQTCLAVPHDHLIVTMGMQKTTPASHSKKKQPMLTLAGGDPCCIRWSFLDAGSKRYVKEVLTNLEAIFLIYPELAKVHLKLFADAMTLYGLPAAGKEDY